MSDTFFFFARNEYFYSAMMHYNVKSDSKDFFYWKRSRKTK